MQTEALNLSSKRVENGPQVTQKGAEK